MTRRSVRLLGRLALLVPRLFRSRARRRHAVHGASVHAEPRRGVDGPHRRPVPGPLPVLVRRLDEEQPASRRPGQLERLREALPGQPALPLGASCRTPRSRTRRGTPRSRRSATTSTRAWTSTRSRRPARRRSLPISTRIAAMRSIRELGADPGLDPRPRTTAAVMFGNGVEQDAKDSTQQIFAIYAGRPRPSRSRLLLQGRRQVEGDARQVRRARREDARAARRHAREREGRRCGGDAHRDRARQGLAHARRAPRPVQGLPPHGPREAAQARARVRLGRLLRARRRASPAPGSTSPSRRSSRSSGRG